MGPEERDALKQAVKEHGQDFRLIVQKYKWARARYGDMQTRQREGRSTHPCLPYPSDDGHTLSQDSSGASSLVARG